MLSDCTEKFPEVVVRAAFSFSLMKISTPETSLLVFASTILPFAEFCEYTRSAKNRNRKRE